MLYGVRVWRSEDSLQESVCPSTLCAPWMNSGHRVWRRRLYLQCPVGGSNRLLIGDVARVRPVFPDLLPDLHIIQYVKLEAPWAFTPSNQVNTNHPLL